MKDVMGYTCDFLGADPYSGQFILASQLIAGNEEFEMLKCEISDMKREITELKQRMGQIYFWSPEWQRGEISADKDIVAGRTKRFSNAEDAIKYLRS